MAYREYQVVPALQPFVKVIWSMESDPGDSSNFSMRILPDTCVEMVIHYRQPLLTTFANGSLHEQPKSFVVSQMKSFIEIAPTGPIGFMSIRFTAKGAYHFFGIPMKELADRVVSLENVWGKLSEEIESRIGETPVGDERSDIIQHYLLLALRKNGCIDKAVEYSLTELYNSNGQISIEQLASKIGLSNRQLVRRFDQRVGMSPKEFSKIVRFIHATNQLKSNEQPINDIAFSCGYYDHAHFFHDFRKFSGLTPGQFQDRSDVFL